LLEAKPARCCCCRSAAAPAAALLLPLLPPTPLHHTFRFTSPPTSLPALPLPASPLTPILRPAAEIIKRRIVGLHQDTAISSVELKDHWEPKEEGLDPIETTRHVSVITITLSKVGGSWRPVGHEGLVGNLWGMRVTPCSGGSSLGSAVFSTGHGSGRVVKPPLGRGQASR
jgi:hypothetical protein